MEKLTSPLKLGGIFSLGLLTGVHINFSTSTLSSILRLASAPQAQKAFTTAVGSLRATVRPLEALSTASLFLAFLLSPKYARHPYLILAGATPLLAIGVERLRLSGVEIGVLEIVSTEAEADGNVVEVNGEVVRGGIENWRRWGLVRGLMVGVGFGLGLVGIWGDRF
ncbi:hypothetical protein RUND412_006378 [Rhizina undulata]